jgi:hypothetical protein
MVGPAKEGISDRMIVIMACDCNGMPGYASYGRVGAAAFLYPVSGQGVDMVDTSKFWARA